MSFPSVLTAVPMLCVATGGLVFATGAAQSQLAQVVQFEVPVRLVDIHPDIKSLSVECSLGAYRAREDVLFQRSYSGVVKLKTAPIANEVAAKHKDWRCRLFLFPAKGNGDQPSFAAKDERYRAKAGTKLVADVKGSVGSGGAAPIVGPVKINPQIKP